MRNNPPNNRGERLADRVAERADDENRDWEREWRRYVGVKLDKHDVADERLAEQQAKTAQIIERILVRLDTLEERPREQRAVFGLTNATIYTLISVAAFIIALLSHVSFH